MRAPKGYGKRYFTLSAIQAFSGAVTLQRRESRTVAHHRMVSDECDETETSEEDDPLLLEALTAALPGGRRRLCHCNRLFQRRTCAVLRNHPRPKTLVNPSPYQHSTLSPPQGFRPAQPIHF